MDIMDRLWEHNEAVYPEINDYFVLALQGSQNYGIADKESDIDSKMLTIPSFKSLVYNSKPQNKVHIMDNDEHCDLKDIREYFKIIRKSNINFVEILFTPYYIVNADYVDEWNYLRDNNEKIARLNPVRALKCMAGMAKEKRHALCHEYPSRMEYIKKYGFDPKQLSHLIRIKLFVRAYTKETPYKDCIYLPDKSMREFLLAVKRNSCHWSIERAIHIADKTLNNIQEIVDDFCMTHSNKEDACASQILDEVLYWVIEKAVKKTLK